jgi:hypothetical protein
MGIQQMEDMFSIVRTKLRYWRDVVDLGAYDLIGAFFVVRPSATHFHCYCVGFVV